MQSETPNAVAPVAIGLNAVLAVVDGAHPKVLCVRGADELWALPYGPFDPARHRTFEIGLRDWVSRQTNVALGYVEQLYTFGDKGREAPAAALTGGDSAARIISVGYLALASEPAAVSTSDTAWRNWYEFFPWEEWRAGEPSILATRIMPALARWARRGAANERGERAARLALAFGLDEAGWLEERALDRYELIYDAGLVAEAWRDARNAGRDLPQGYEPSPGEIGAAMASDHRRILATAIGRLRGKLKYRPVIFEMMPDEFTLLELQLAVEAIVGFELHKQNFRRSAEQSGLVQRTNRLSQRAGGRPAALFALDRTGLAERTKLGLAIPRLRVSPGASSGIA